MTNTERAYAAVKIAKQKGAILNSDACVAQGALESGWWKSRLCAKYNNVFGVKAGTSWKGPTVDMWTAEYYGGKYHKIIAKWRVYPSWNEAMVDYAKLIGRQWWFKDALPHADPPDGDGDAMQWIAHLVDRDVPGELMYATGPNYVSKVLLCLQQLKKE